MDRKIYFIWVMLCIITHFIRTVYEVLKYKKILKPDKLSFIIIFINMAILWISWFSLCSLDIFKFYIPLIIRFWGLLLSIIGIIIFLISLFTIKSLESYDGDLITYGIYSKIRHPMYLGFIFWLIGFPIYSEALFSMCLSVLFIANILFWRYLEEKELGKRFPKYMDYKEKTLF